MGNLDINFGISLIKFFTVVMALSSQTFKGVLTLTTDVFLDFGLTSIFFVKNKELTKIGLNVAEIKNKLGGLKC